MVRWRLGLALALLLLLPTIISSKSNDDEDDEDSENKEDLKLSKIPKSKYQPSRRNEESDDDDDDDDEEDDDEAGKESLTGGGNLMVDRGPQESARRAPIVLASPKPLDAPISRTTKKRPLECYVCAFKAETPLRACLDPTKFRVHTITCHSVEDKCFTSVISKGDYYEAVVRGCRSGCVGSAETTCCDANRCNNQAFAMPLVQPRSASKQSASGTKAAFKCFPPTVVFFVTILLVLQTVARVSIV